MRNLVFDKKNTLRILFALGAILGAVSFIMVYGIRILDFTNTGWLFYGDNDLRQHYIAWCNYRHDPWHFPIGLVDSLSYPNSMSIIYTDSIPLFAVIFKLFRNLLPVTFQYFGLFGLLSFMLMGGLSSVFLNRFTDNLAICVLGSEFYIMSFTVIQRMYYHTALGAQWIIILALILWVYDDCLSSRAKIISWGLMGFICVSIHSYFLPMTGMILAADMVMQYVKQFKRDGNKVTALILPALEFLAFCVVGLLMLFILGGFYGESNGYAGGLGSFNANLNTFINPLDHGRMLRELPRYYEFQHEGFGYLGCGIFFLFIVVGIGMIFRIVRKTPEKSFHSTKLYGILTIAVVVASITFATLPLISYNDKKLVWIPYPGIVERVLGIFRSNGRFIWVAVYILITAAITFTAYTFRQYKDTAIVVILMALVLQLYDGSNMYMTRHEYFTKEYPIYIMWDDPELSSFIEGKEEFIFLYLDNDITLPTAYYGYLHNMRQNNYYYARDIDNSIEEYIKIYTNELENGLVRQEAVYVLTSDMYYANRSFFDSIPVRVLDKYDHVIMVSEE